MQPSTLINLPLLHGYLIPYLLLLCTVGIDGQNNIFSFIAPFLGSGTGAPPATASSTDGFASLFQLPQQLAGSGAPEGGGNNAAKAAGVARTILSTFSNSDGPGSNNPFGEFFNLGQALGGASNPSNQQPSSSPPKPPLFAPPTFAPFAPPPTLPPFVPPPTLIPQYTVPPRVPGRKAGRSRGIATGYASASEIASEPPTASSHTAPSIFTFLEDVAKRQRSRQHSPSHSPSRPASTPIGRLTDNFGQNFFKMLEELHEYSPNAPQPLSPASISQIGDERQLQRIEHDARKADDIMSSNQLMQAFFRTMSGGRQPMAALPAFNDGTETGRNRPLMGQLFESDILLTSRQMKAIVIAEAERRTPRRRVKRKVITGAVYRWSNKQGPIPYSFREHDQNWMQVIRQGLGLWEKETCLRFAENSPGTDRIEFIQGSGCYSSVGKTGGTQKISIGHGCEDKGIVSHEVGHSLGFWHEQSRPDRDHYIQLNAQYIAGGTDGNFAKRSDLETDGMGLPYDLGSVMHYGPTAFTTDWDQKTIITKDPKYQRSVGISINTISWENEEHILGVIRILQIGQRHGPSFIDVKQINRLYCHQACIGTPVQCENGGYADPNNCLRCKCPPGIGGPRCNQVEASVKHQRDRKCSDGLCGGELVANTQWQHLTHKGKGNCHWRIKADAAARIRFILDSVSYSCETTCHSYVEIKHNSDFQQSGFRACCDEKNLEVISDQDEIYIISHSLDVIDGAFTLRYIKDSGVPLPRPPPPAWIPGRENRNFRGVQGKGGVIEKFILNSIPKVRDHQKPVESVLSILTDYFASSLLGTTRDSR